MTFGPSDRETQLREALARLIAAVDPYGLDMENTPFEAHTEFAAAIFSARAVLAATPPLRRVFRGQVKRVYLGGPINGCTDEEASGWREQAKSVLLARGYDWCDPMMRDYRGLEMEPGIAAEIVEGDKRDIDGCDLLLMNCPKPSVGTSMEILYGFERGKRVVAVVPSGHVPSPWLLYHCERVAEGSSLVEEIGRL